MTLPADPAPEAVADWAFTLVRSRQTILPKRLVEPGPGEAQLARIVEAAAAAPDHAQLLPWRFVLVPATARGALADAFEQSLAERDPQATPEERAQAREKAFRSPTLLLAVARLSGPDDTCVADEPRAREVPDAERLVSAGCAIQNMLLMATALGFGSALTSGKALASPGFRALFSLAPSEQALCFISIGTPTQRKPARPLAEAGRYMSTLQVRP